MGKSPLLGALLFAASSSSSLVYSASTILSLRVFLSFVKLLVHRHSAHGEDVVETFSFHLEASSSPSPQHHLGALPFLFFSSSLTRAH